MMIRRCGSANFSGSGRSQTPGWFLALRGPPNCTKFGGHRHCLTSLLLIQICCSAWKRGRLKGDWARKSRPSLTLFTPVKFRGGRGRNVPLRFSYSTKPSSDVLLIAGARRSERGPVKYDEKNSSKM